MRYKVEFERFISPKIEEEDPLLTSLKKEMNIVDISINDIASDYVRSRLREKSITSMILPAVKVK